MKHLSNKEKLKKLTFKAEFAYFYFMKRKKRKEQPPDFRTKHGLPFESRPWHLGDGWQNFKIGTCSGLWRSTAVYYDILSIANSSPGNGHLEDAFQWFSHCCRRDGKLLRILELMNKDFQKHLLKKRGFTPEGDHCIKKFI